MPLRHRFETIKTYPRPHELDIGFGIPLESGVNNQQTCIPLLHYDEGLGDPASYNANPEHASFAEYNASNCYPQSRIDNIWAEITVSLTKAALETDKIHALKFAFMIVHMAFPEIYDAVDELTGSKVETIIKMQKETTDRQGYPLYNGVDMLAGVTGTQHSFPAGTMPGLTADDKLEGLSLGTGAYYDNLHYGSNSGQTKKAQSGLKWLTLSRRSPMKKIRIHMKSGAKRMNPYTFLGVHMIFPVAGNNAQLFSIGDTTNVTHVYVNAKVRYYEWNLGYDMNRS